MKKTTAYLGPGSVQYFFTEHEIMQALIAAYNIKPSNQYGFGLYEQFGDEPAHAELTIEYTKEELQEVT